MLIVDLFKEFASALMDADEKQSWVDAEVGKSKFYVTANKNEIQLIEEISCLPALQNKFFITLPDLNFNMCDEFQDVSNLSLTFGRAKDDTSVHLLTIEDKTYAITTNEKVVAASKSLALI
jgi:hypothetical protein